jgi:hypothetical protein
VVRFRTSTRSEELRSEAEWFLGYAVLLLGAGVALLIAGEHVFGVVLLALSAFGWRAALTRYRRSKGTG